MIKIIMLQALYGWHPTCAIISKDLATTCPLMLWNYKYTMRGLNEVGKINIVCEGFVKSEIHDAYCFILNSIF